MPDGTDSLRVVVAGLLASYPIGGLVAHYLQYVLGLRALGHEVLYLEDTGWYYDPFNRVYVDHWRPLPDDASFTPPLDSLASTMEAFGLGEHWTYVDLEGTSHGVQGSRLNDFLRSADVFVHVTGSGFLREEYLAIPHRAFVDTDPVYTQLRVLAGEPENMDHLRKHTSHFTFGANLGRDECDVDTLGVRWRHTVQPVYRPLWTALPVSEDAPFTTVLTWDSYEPVEHRGRTYGMKDVEFRRFSCLPELTDQPLELAVSGATPIEDDRLRHAGWRIRDAIGVSSTLDAYREYIAASRGEWSVAKNGYVATGSGWFSERSANYLASGRPVVVQSTGFERWLPTGQGVLSFSTIEEAAAAVEEVAGNYEVHRKAALEIAGEYFDSNKVLTGLIERATGRDG
jgi:hypothetical protein